MDHAQVRQLFLKVLDLEPEQRSAFLDKTPISPEDKAQVSALLKYESGSETFFEKIVAREQPQLPLDDQFGAYRVVDLLGRGGMGAVFKAERTDGEMSQVVAIKVVEAGWFDPRASERFRQERQFLANLVHQNIARLLDGGTRQDGLAYLVMEYVEGLPLDQYCARHELEITERLRLFLPLCGAVEYAHQKLIVHRDLKPSNVLVTERGEPKLLDFGVAKALDAHAAGRTQTVMLTPEYASPEQVRGEEATTATDVYGLGAVLYHLLTGHAPHTVEHVSPVELHRRICETVPKRPSEQRALLAGDLENILLKALHPEPRRRYGSVHELAEDVQQYLDRRPVRATGDSSWYRTRRFLERHTLASTAAVVAICAIVAGVSMSIL